MSITVSDDFQVITSDIQSGELPRLVLKYLQRPDHIELAGGYLEAQFLIDTKHLLFVSEGNPYEEALYIYLIDFNLRVMDSLELSAHYTPAILANILLDQPNKIKFSFFDKSEFWCLEVLAKPQWIFWGNKYPIKRRSSFFQKSWLELKKT